MTNEEKARQYDAFVAAIRRKADEIVADAVYDRCYDEAAPTPMQALDNWLDGLDNLFAGRQYGAEAAYDMIEAIVAENYPGIYRTKNVA